jgi:membrane fusion protein, multidrug efflux system
LRPNQFVRARLKGAVRPNALAVPLRAVQQGPKGHFVWVVGKENTVEMRPVAMGSWVGDEWQITGGLEPNSVVVVDGALSLTSGATVKPRPLPAVAAPLAAAAAKEDVKQPSTFATAGALPARVYFANGSASLDANAKETVRAIGNGLTGVPYVVEITGYVDASGPAAKNRSLAEQRAKAVRDALVAAGAPADRMRLKPPASVVGAANDGQGRRVEIAFAIR